MADFVKEDAGEKDIDLLLGKRIRQHRQNAKMTLEALAMKAGVSKALLSKIENGKVSSPISTYMKISSVLGVPMAEMLRTEDPPKFLIVRKDEKKPSQRKETPYGYSFESLGDRWPAKDWNPFLVTYEPIDAPHKSPGFSYEGEEFVYVLEGRLEFFWADNRYELEPGDCLFVDGSVPHGGRALDNKKCLALFIVFTHGA